MDFIEIILPKDEAEGTQSVVATWFKKVGDAVSINEPLLEISTDKVSVEIAAPVTGVLREINKKEGESVEPGEVLGRIEAGAAVEATAEAAGAMATAARGAGAGVSPAASDLAPAVRRVLREHGIDHTLIKGTGRGGRITVEDVERYVAVRGSGSATDENKRRSRRVAHTPMRRTIAAHMAESVKRAPHATSVFEVDLTAVLEHRAAHKAVFQAKGVPLTYTAYFVRASVAALQKVPETNSRWYDDELELFEECNIGIGTALELGGLIVPVLRRAEELDLFRTAERLHDFVTRSRSGTLEPKDVQGGTFTISNHGVSGSLLAAPIVINQPQSAILGVGKVERRVVVTDSGSFEARPKAYVTLTIDHRVLDGYHANAFLTEWVRVIEAWK